MTRTLVRRISLKAQFNATYRADMRDNEPADQVARVPKAAQIEEILRQRIFREFKSGERFNSELELAERFGVSRTLIRNVLERLESDRLIRREAKRGTFISPDVPQVSSLKLNDLIEQLWVYDRGAKVKIIGIEAVAEKRVVASRLSVSEAEDITLIKRQIFLKGKPAIYMLTYLCSSLAEGITVQQLERAPLWTYLATKRGRTVTVHRVEQTIQPGVADVEVAQYLDVPVGAPVLIVDRHWLRANGIPIFYTCSYYRGDRYKYSVTMRMRGRSKGRRKTRAR